MKSNRRRKADFQSFSCVFKTFKRHLLKMHFHLSNNLLFSIHFKIYNILLNVELVYWTPTRSSHNHLITKK